MGVIKVEIPDEEERRFRENAMEVFGHRRGSLTRAARKAIEEWNSKLEGSDSSRDEGLGSFLHGRLSGEAGSGLELQESMEEAYEDEVLD